MSLSEPLILIKPAPPARSWWICQTREEFQAAYQREAARIKAQGARLAEKQKPDDRGIL